MRVFEKDKLSLLSSIASFVELFAAISKAFDLL